MEWIVGIVGLLMGGATGAALAYLLAERRWRPKALAAEQNLVEQQQLLARAEQSFRDTFASLSSEALHRNNEAFLNLANQKFTTLSTEAAGNLDERKAQIETLLKPMEELLRQYQSRLGEVEKSRQEAYGTLRQQITALGTQTTQLVGALRRPQTRGQWGEIALRRLVELAGMTDRCDFIEQASVSTEDGRQRPDMIIRLPGERQIVIDSKAVLDAFLDAAACTDETARLACMQRHAAQVRSRANDLAKKAYWSQFENTPEYVVMFLPGEAFLYGAVEHDPALIEDAIQSRVIIATPTTLISLLKAIELGWRQESVAENAEQIRELGTQLFDRLVKMTNDFVKLGGSIELAVKSYNEMVGSLESRVLVTARKIGELGARSDKELPEVEVIDRQPRQLSPGNQTLFK